MIINTKLWVDVQQGEDEGEFLIFLLSEESYEADKVVEQEWNQHRCSNLWMRGENTDILINDIYILLVVTLEAKLFYPSC